MNKHFSARGTTMVELVLYMGLLVIFLGVIFSTFASILSVQTRSAAVSVVQTNGNYLLAKFNYDINKADSIVVPASIGTTATSLTLKNGTTNSVYSITGNFLQLADGTGTYNLNDVDCSVSNLVFARLGNIGGKNALQINFTLTSLIVEHSAPKTANFQTVVSLR